MDELRRRSFRLMLGESWAHGVEPAIDIALLGRYYERIADHAVSLARRVVYLVTGEVPAALDRLSRHRQVSREPPSWRVECRFFPGVPRWAHGCGASVPSSGIDFVEEFASAAEWFADHVARTTSAAPGSGLPRLDRARPRRAPRQRALVGREHRGDRRGSARAGGLPGLAPVTPRVGVVPREGRGPLQVLRSPTPKQPCWNFAFGAGSRASGRAGRPTRRSCTASTWPGRRPRGAAAGAARRRRHRRGAHGVPATACTAAGTPRRWSGRSRCGPPTSGAPGSSSPCRVRPSPRSRARPTAGPGAAPTGPPPSSRVGQRAGVDRIEGPAALVLKVLWKRRAPTGPTSTSSATRTGSSASSDRA